MRERDLDDFDAEQRGGGITGGRCCHTAWELGGRAHACRAGNVHVDVRRILRIEEHAMRVRPSARLDIADVFRGGDVGNVEDPDAAQANVARRGGQRVRATVEAPAETLAGHEKEVSEDGDIAL